MIIIIIFCILFLLGTIYFLCMWHESQVLGYFPYHGPTGKKVIAITFDDGPNPPHTNRLLEILSSHNVKATFFTVGKNLEKFPEFGKMIVESGHTIANHSYSHEFSQYFKQLSFEKEITKTQKIIKDLTGKTPALFRPPWLFRMPPLFKTLKRNGLIPISGIFGSQMEIWQISGEKIAQDALRVSAPGVILMFHDGFDAKGGNRAETVNAIDILIPELKKQGYEFVTIDQLLDIPAYQ